MLVNKNEFEIIKAHLGYQLESDKDLIRIIKNIEERNAKINKRTANAIKERRKENPEYGHSKKEIEDMRKRNAKKSLGI